MFRVIIIAILTAAFADASAAEQVPTSSASVSDFKSIALYENDSVCLKGFEKDDLIFIAKGYKLKGFKNSFSVAIYNPRTGLLVSHPIPEWHGLQCDQIVMSYSPRIDRVNLQHTLRYASGKTREILDQYTSHPDRIAELIPKPEENKQYSYLSDTIVVDPMPRYYETIGEAAAYVKRFSNEQAEALAEKEQEKRDWEEAFAKKDSERQKARNLAIQQARLAWDNRLSYTLAVGDRVCTYDTNFIGDVEAINNGRVKVHVIGQADTRTPGLFFGLGPDVNIKYFEAPRWFDRNEIAKCAWAEGPLKPNPTYSPLADPTTQRLLEVYGRRP